MTPRVNLLVRLSIFSFVLSVVTVEAAPAKLQSATGHLVPGLPGSAALKPDQVNVNGWDKGWTNLVNDVEQRFRPSQPKLTAVEVELVVGNPDTGKDELTLTVLDKSGNALVSVTQTVLESDCEHTLFRMPDKGIDVTPGESYWIRLSGGPTFGWKYIVGGYAKGEATFNGKALLEEAKSSFLFRTFSCEPVQAH